jgi:preprotein translocase subunit YajC
MLDSLVQTIVFAQDGAAAPQQGGGLYQLLFMGSIIMVMFYFMLIRPNQKRDQERRSMLATLKKNDHVVTVGGIKGVVANVKADEDEVVLRIDEATGAKVRVVISSIARVIAAEENAPADKKES